MSDSGLSDASAAPVPSDAKVQDSLRKEVRKAAKKGGDVTVRRVREASIQSLGLREDFFSTDKWKSVSKEIIHTEYDRIQNEDGQSPKPAAASKLTPKSKAPAPKRSAKQAPSTANSPPRKKRKPSLSEDELSALSSEPRDVDSEVDVQPRKVTSKTAAAVKSPKPAPKPKPKPAKIETPPDAENDGHESESEMSVVLDDGPPKKQQTKAKAKAGATTQDSKSSKAKLKAGTDDDPEKEEIKKLQGWLVKCGVRKVWGKELKPYETSRAKIKHLKDMLVEVGMTGRFSNEKAAQIKEARELAADIEAVQEGAQRWGKDEDSVDDGESKTRGGRRLVRGAMNYDFLSSDGEETD